MSSHCSGYHRVCTWTSTPSSTHFPYSGNLAWTDHDCKVSIKNYSFYLDDPYHDHVLTRLLGAPELAVLYPILLLFSIEYHRTFVLICPKTLWPGTHTCLRKGGGAYQRSLIWKRYTFFRCKSCFFYLKSCKHTFIKGPMQFSDDFLLTDQILWVWGKWDPLFPIFTNFLSKKGPPFFF